MTLRNRIAVAALLAVGAVTGNALHAQRPTPPVNDMGAPWACFVTAGIPCGCQSGKCLVNCYCPG